MHDTCREHEVLQLERLAPVKTACGQGGGGQLGMVPFNIVNLDVKTSDFLVGFFLETLITCYPIGEVCQRCHEEELLEACVSLGDQKASAF